MLYFLYESKLKIWSELLCNILFYNAIFGGKNSNSNIWKYTVELLKFIVPIFSHCFIVTDAWGHIYFRIFSNNYLQKEMWLYNHYLLVCRGCLFLDMRYNYVSSANTTKFEPLRNLHSTFKIVWIKKKETMLCFYKIECIWITVDSSDFCNT